MLVMGADILDKTNQNAFSFGRLREEPSWYQLEENQRQHFEEVQRKLKILIRYRMRSWLRNSRRYR
jgi:hypothetical protein